MQYLDKESIHYFMCHMTQKQWSKIVNNRKLVKNHKFNKINYGTSSTSSSTKSPKT